MLMPCSLVYVEISSSWYSAALLLYIYILFFILFLFYLVFLKIIIYYYYYYFYEIGIWLASYSIYLTIFKCYDSPIFLFLALEGQNKVICH